MSLPLKLPNYLGDHTDQSRTLQEDSEESEVDHIYTFTGKTMIVRDQDGKKFKFENSFLFWNCSLNRIREPPPTLSVPAPVPAFFLKWGWRRETYETA